MKSLEQLAEKLFVEYVYRRTKTRGKWRLLSRERKKDWVEDTQFLLDTLLKELSSQFKISTAQPTSVNSYSQGWHDGRLQESKRFANVLTDIKNKLDEDLDQWENSKNSTDNDKS